MKGSKSWHEAGPAEGPRQLPYLTDSFQRLEAGDQNLGPGLCALLSRPPGPGGTCGIPDKCEIVKARILA